MIDQTIIDRCLHLRARAVANNDPGIVREIDSYLARKGYRPDGDNTVAEARIEAEVKPRRGRPPIRRDI